MPVLAEVLGIGSGGLDLWNKFQKISKMPHPFRFVLDLKPQILQLLHNLAYHILASTSLSLIDSIFILRPIITPSSPNLRPAVHLEPELDQLGLEIELPQLYCRYCPMLLSY